MSLWINDYKISFACRKTKFFLVPLRTDGRTEPPTESYESDTNLTTDRSKAGEGGGSRSIVSKPAAAVDDDGFFPNNLAKTLILLSRRYNDTISMGDVKLDVGRRPHSSQAR